MLAKKSKLEQKKEQEGKVDICQSEWLWHQLQRNPSGAEETEHLQNVPRRRRSLEADLYPCNSTET